MSILIEHIYKDAQKNGKVAFAKGLSVVNHMLFWRKLKTASGSLSYFCMSASHYNIPKKMCIEIISQECQII